LHGIRPAAAQGVFESDHHLENELRQDLLAALRPLEDVPDADKDWHPESDEQVARHDCTFTQSSLMRILYLCSIYALFMAITVRMH
jgi:hypothetical protein